jgi:DNA processing protein
MNSLGEELLYSISLSLVPQVGCIQARILLEQLGSAKKIFHTSRSRLEKIPGIGPVRAAAISSFRDHKKAEKEIRFIEHNNIKPLLYFSPDYPLRLKNCPDPPPLLFFKGNADLNTKKILSIVGTRKQTDIGKEIIDAYIEAWGEDDILIISGLAYGVDQLAHRACLRNNIQTVGVLAHGLDKIYPPSHLSLAREMKEKGGLVSEFLSGTQPDKQNFPRRNRIVAGICDALLVIETDIKGGSMITAELAAGYNREVFAVPGRIHDEKSQGCNYLIRENKARLTMHPSDILEFMNWASATKTERVPVAPLFNDLDPDQLLITGLLRDHGIMHIDQIQSLSGLPHSRFSSILLCMEMDRIILQVPGKQYKLNQVGGAQNLLRI